MKQITKALLLAATLLVDGQSTCSDAPRAGYLSAFKFSSWTFPSLSMPSFSSFNGLFTRLKLSDSQKEHVKKWTPVALGVGGALGIWTAWACWKHSVRKKNRAVTAQHVSITPTQKTPATPVIPTPSQVHQTYCQETGCWQTNTCSIHTRSDNPHDVSFAELEELVQERNALERQEKEIQANARRNCQLPFYGYSGQELFDALDILTTAPDRKTRLNDRIALGIKQSR